MGWPPEAPSHLVLAAPRLGACSTRLPGEAWLRPCAFPSPLHRPLLPQEQFQVGDHTPRSPPGLLVHSADPSKCPLVGQCPLARRAGPSSTTLGSEEARPLQMAPVSKAGVTPMRLSSPRHLPAHLGTSKRKSCLETRWFGHENSGPVSTVSREHTTGHPVRGLGWEQAAGCTEIVERAGPSPGQQTAPSPQG